MLVLFDGKLGARQTQRFTEEMLHAGHWSWDLETGVMQWSRGLMELLGLEAGAVTPSYAAFEEAIHPDDKHDQGDLEQMLRSSIAVEREFRIVNSSGRVRWIALKAEPIAGPVGRLNRAVAICYDITKHREELRLLQQSEDRLRGFAQLAKELMWVAKPNGTLVKVLNRRGADRARSEETATISWPNLVHPDDREEFEDQWARALGSRQPMVLEHRLRESDGNYAPYWTRALPTLTPNGDVQEWVGLSRNIQNSRDFYPEREEMPTGTQIRAGRAVIGWSVKQLSEAARLSASTIRGLEEFDTASPRHKTELEAIRAALFEAGVEFTFSADGKPGVRPR